MYSHIDIGILEIPTYWLMNIFGVLAAYFMLRINNEKHKEYQLPKQDVLFLVLYAVIGGIIGSRLFFIITNIPLMMSDSSLIVPIVFMGGSVFYGGVIGGVIFAFLYIRLYGLDPIKYFNIFVISVPLGHAFGRIGCFLAGCCYGKPTDSIFGVIFPPSHVHPEGSIVPLHPTQLYESFYNLIIFAILMFVFYKVKKHKPYMFVSMYLVLYGIARFINEFFRGDEHRGIFLLSTSQWISIVLVGLGVYLWFGRVERFSLFTVKPPKSKTYIAYMNSKNKQK